MTYQSVSAFPRKLYLTVFGGMMLFGMHFFQSNIGGVGLDMPFNAMVWIFGAALISIGIWTIEKYRKLFYNKSLIIISLGVIGLWVPMLYPNQEAGEYALGRLMGLSAGLLLIFSIIQIQLSSKDWVTILWMIVGGVFIESTLSLMIFYDFILNQFLHIDIQDRRASGIFAQPNVASTFMLCGITCGAWILTESKNINNFKKFFIYITIFLSTWVIALNVSRIGHLSLIAFILLSAPLLFQKIHRKDLQQYYISMLVGLIIPVILNVGADLPMTTRESLSTAPRISIWLVSTLMIYEKPFLGWGYGQTQSSYMESQAKHIEEGKYNIERINDIDHPHNEILYWGIEGGLLPILVIIFLSLYTSFRLFSLPWKRSLFLLSTILPLILHSMVEYPFYHSAILWILFCLLLANIFTETDNSKFLIPHLQLTPKVFAIVLFALSTIYMTLDIQAVKQIFKFHLSNYQKIEFLKEIISPLPQLTRYSAYIHGLSLQNAIASNDKEAMYDYIDWHNNIKIRITKATFYKNHIIALIHLKKHQEAKELYLKSQQIFGKKLSFFAADFNSFLSTIKK